MPVLDGVGYATFFAGTEAGYAVVTGVAKDGREGFTTIPLEALSFPSPPPPTAPAPTSPTPAPAPSRAEPSTRREDQCLPPPEEPSPEEPSTPTDEMYFEWEYGDQLWSWSAALPEEWFDYYASRERPSDPSDYAVLATDPYDDPLISQLVCRLREAATEEGYTELQTVEFALAFVQSLDYVQDKVGVGFDDYPKFPVETLVDQQGDCEDSSILFAALVHELGYGVVLLFFDHTLTNPEVGHVAVGVAASSLPGTYWSYQDMRYYYVETTNSGWRVGEVPDAVRGISAKILPLLQRAVLTVPDWTSTSEEGYYRFDVTVKNIGTATAGNLVVWVGWDAGGNRAWNAERFDDGTDLDPDEEGIISLWVRPPPRSVTTRALVQAWASNAAMVQSWSDWFTS